jgi:DNA mismatch endonuclease (patch repair protein)
VADHLSREGRSRNMAAIRAKDTKPELAMRRKLHAAGVRGWRCHVRGIPGKPDLAFTRWKVAVFIDGAFWHGHPDHFKFGRGGYWDAKIARTQERDRIANETLQAEGWTVLRFWDFDVNQDLDKCAAAVLDALVSAGRPLSRPSSSRPSSPLPAA